MASGSAAPRGDGGGGGGFNAPASSTNPTNPPAPTTPAAPSLSPADVHVLLVDDERMQRMVVASLLRKCSYKGACVDEKREEEEFGKSLACLRLCSSVFGWLVVGLREKGQR